MTAVVRVYGAVLLCRRLLRALVAAAASSAVVFVVLIPVVVAVAVGWLIAGRTWPGGPGETAIGLIIIVSAFLLFLGAQVLTVMWLVRGAARGSAPVGYALLALAVLGIGISGADLADRIPRIQTGPNPGGELLGAAVNLFPLYIAAAFIYAAIGVIRLARHPLRETLTVHERQPGWRQALVNLTGWPGGALLETRSARVRAFAALALLCEGSAFSAYFVTGSTADLPNASLFAGVIVVAVGWPVSIAMMYGLLALADWLWDRSRRAGQMSLVQITAADRRAPVLFLRSFTDDQVSLTAARVPLYLRILDPGIVAHKFEELIVSRCSQLGPVVAIGRPRDVQPPIGAAREYLADQVWQPYVVNLMDQAAAVVVSLSMTEGLAWELDQIRLRGHLGKTLLVIPPDLTCQRTAVATRAAQAGLKLAADQLADPALHPIAGWLRSDGEPAVTVTRRLTELAYDVALRLFIAGRSRAEGNS
ncbi:MAG TPA: hypothetical protein VFP89_07795 [Propionibacteriaceae bacterium]|nr:hypothetical protein [Propionibacteriaceae bacterium]